jgi:hypothetical protein
VPERIYAADPESRDLATIAIVSLELLACRRRTEGDGMMAARLEALARRVAEAEEPPDLLTVIQICWFMNDLVQLLPWHDPELVEAGRRIHQRAWLRERGVFPSCFPRPVTLDASARISLSQ